MGAGRCQRAGGGFQVHETSATTPTSETRGLERTGDLAAPTPRSGAASKRGRSEESGQTVPEEADCLPPASSANIRIFRYFICCSVGSAARSSSLCLVGSTLMYSFTITPCGLMMNVLRIAIVIPFIV